MLLFLHLIDFADSAKSGKVAKKKIALAAPKSFLYTSLQLPYTDHLDSPDAGLELALKLSEKAVNSGMYFYVAPWSTNVEENDPVCFCRLFSLSDGLYGD